MSRGTADELIREMDKERSVSELAKRIGRSETFVRQRIRALLEIGFIERRDGKYIVKSSDDGKEAVFEKKRYAKTFQRDSEVLDFIVEADEPLTIDAIMLGLNTPKNLVYLSLYRLMKEHRVRACERPGFGRLKFYERES